MLYVNEGAFNNDTLTLLRSQLGHFSEELNFISIDTYDGYRPGETGAEEVPLVKEFYETAIFPLLAPKQRVFVVPGTFACRNQSYKPNAASDRQVATKLRAYDSLYN